MKKSFILLSAIIFFSVNMAYAKRLPAPEVEPVVYEGVRYMAPNSSDKMGVVEAYDVATGKKLWEKKLYDVEYDPALEGDVQDVWIKEMRIEHHDGNDALIVIDERARFYEVPIPGDKMSGKKQESDLRNAQDSPLGISIVPLADSYSPGEPIVFTVYFRNISSEKIFVIKGDYIYPQCRLVVTDPQGHELSYDPAPGCNEIRCLDLGPAPADAYLAIAPGQNVKYFTFNAIAGRELGNKFNWWSAGREAGPYPFKATGTYKVGFQYVNPSPAHPEGLRGIFTSKSISIKIAGTEGISQEAALERARVICKQEGWDWKDVHISEIKKDNREVWFITTNSSQLGRNAFIYLDKVTGVVTDKSWNSR